MSPLNSPLNSQLNSLIKYFEGLSPELLVLIGGVYTDNAYFKDPFNEVRGIAQVKNIYLRRFSTYRQPYMKVRQSFTGADGTALRWDLTFSLGAMTRTISGMTLLRLDYNGRIEYHRDFWDATEAIYAKIPGMSAVMRYAKRKASVAA